MKLSPSIVWRPVWLFIALGLVVMLIPSLVISTWYTTIKQVEHTVKFVSDHVHNEALLEIETIARSLLPINSSAQNLARLLSSLNATQLSTFSTIETKVVPNLFLVFSTLPLSQISYIRSDGIFFSYYIEGNRTVALYANTSFVEATANASTVYKWYTQRVDQNIGKRYGKVIVLNSVVSTNSIWFQEALNSTHGHAWSGTGRGITQELLFLSTVAMDGGGVVSLGFPVKTFTDVISGIIDIHQGSLYLTTKYGKLLKQTGPLNATMVLNNDAVSIQFMKSNGDRAKTVNISCKPNDNPSRASDVKIWGTKYMIYCAPLKIAGVQLVSVLVFPHKELMSLIYKHSHLALMLLSLMVASVGLSVTFFMLVIIRAARREMFLCAALIKQMEATKQAERKSMNKSLAFASASHDVRTSLAAITGVIELCREEVNPRSELEMNLAQMNTCAEDLIGILNSVLDTSKIEAGKMQLEEEEFDLAQLLEESVNMFYPIGIKKGVDVVLDPCDDSVIKSSHVKGDRGKLKQILNNLLSNAVKFTSEGHVSVRAWVEKPSLESSILASNNVGLWSCLPRILHKNSESYNDLSSLHTVQQNRNFTKFVFEVDDTGKGIPKEKQKSVFENFVQVKETALGQGGTGLGLGIVQSLVRLMGGEIRIMDKDPCERGTCFKFNIFLSTCETTSSTVSEGENVKLLGNQISNELRQHLGLNIRNQSPKSKGSHVVLLIQGNERRRISKKFMENLGIKVSIVDRWERLFSTLEKIKHKLHLTHFSSSEKFELGSLSSYMSNSTSHNSNMGTKLKDVPMSITDEMGHILPLHRMTSFRSTLSCILIVIDVGAGPFLEMCSIVANFSRDLHDSQCKVVWLDNPITSSMELRSSKEKMLVPCDHIVIKPFHGTRLYRMLRMLPEFGGTIQGYAAKTTKKVEQPSTSTDPSPFTKSAQQVGHGGSNPSRDKPLSGKKVLVVEDVLILRKVVEVLLNRLGATIEFCENGEEAAKQVCKALQETNQRTQGTSKIIPYDYIFMDCEMPIMNGYEATRQIRMEERRYDVHIPIIALTAHAAAEEATKSMQAGMDFHLTKPLKVDQLLDAIRSIHSNEN